MRLSKKVLFVYVLGLICLVNNPAHSLLQSVAEDDASHLYISRRNLSFSALPEGNQIRVATIKTIETSAYSSYFSVPQYIIESEASQHSLTAIGFRRREFTRSTPREVEESKHNKFNTLPMFNLDASLLMDFANYDFLQARALFDRGFLVANPVVPQLLVGPTIGLGYSYFGSTSKFASSAEEEIDPEIGEKDQLYLIRDNNTNKYYLPTMGPHNLTGYWGIYIEFYTLRFIEFSGAFFYQLFDVPFVSNAELNQSDEEEKNLSLRGIELRFFVIDVKLTFVLEYLGIKAFPFFVGYRFNQYSSLGLSEEGFYFGVVASQN